MIRARESSDRWGRRAHRILDRATAGHGQPEHIEWALAYLGDKPGSTKIPRELMGGPNRQAVPA